MTKFIGLIDTVVLSRGHKGVLCNFNFWFNMIKKGNWFHKKKSQEKHVFIMFSLSLPLRLYCTVVKSRVNFVSLIKNFNNIRFYNDR